MKYQNFSHKDEFFKYILNQIQLEINDLSKTELINLDESDYIQYMFDKYYIQPLSVSKESGVVRTPIPIKREVQSNPYEGLYGFGRRAGKIIYEGYKIEVEYPFTGDPRLFFVRPNSFYIGGALPEIKIDDVKNIVILSHECWDKDSNKFNKDKEQGFDNTIKHRLTINPEIEKFNLSLKNRISSIFRQRKEECIAEDSFFKAINVKPKSDEEAKVITPIIKKKTTPKPRVAEKTYDYYPSMADSMYEDIIKTLNQTGQNWEKYPSIYLNKDEEALRDLFLTHLITRYDFISATSETFNYGGKTDICLKDPSTNANLFIAECKIWKGVSIFHKAINQLFDRYLTVRDSKVALMFFVYGKDFNRILETIKNEAPKHPYYIASKGHHTKSSCSYEFCLPNDRDQKVKLEIMAFHFPKNEEYKES